jgi:hypothetical protein
MLGFDALSTNPLSTLGTLTAGPVTHNTTGVLTGQGSVVVGSAASYAKHPRLIQSTAISDWNGLTSYSITLNNVRAGSTLILMGNYRGTPTSVSDGTTELTLCKTVLNANSQTAGVYKLVNVSSGNKTVTITFGSGSQYNYYYLAEIYCNNVTEVKDVKDNAQDNTGTSTDDITSGQMTSVPANAFLLATTSSSTNNGFSQLAGTGWTQDRLIADAIKAGSAQYKYNVSAGNYTATFTNTSYSEDTFVYLISLVNSKTKGVLVGSGAVIAGSASRSTGGVTHATTGVLTGSGSAVVGSASSATTRATSGVLTGQGSVVAGTSARTRNHANTGVLTGQGTIVVGSASSATTRTSTGVLVGSGAVIVGSASSATTRATSGVLVGGGASVVGSANRSTGAVTHSTTAVLLGGTGSSSIVGSSNRTRVHSTTAVLLGGTGTIVGSASSKTTRTSTGALVGSGAVIAGTASSATTRSSTGVLTGSGASVVGSANRSTGFVTHATTAVLLGGTGASIVVGSSNRTRVHSATAVLLGGTGTIVGSASSKTTRTSSGVLVGSGSVVTGTSTHLRTHTSTGVLLGQGSVVVGASNRFVEGLTDYRITENLNQRVTENLDIRILESDSSSANLVTNSSLVAPGKLRNKVGINLVSTSTLQATGEIIPFSGDTHNKVAGVWKDSIPFAKHSGNWTTPILIAIKTNGSWKRVY